MAISGPNTIGYVGSSGYSVLANRVGFSYKPVGVTIDWTAVTAEASPRTLPGGYVTTIGEKIIDAGTVLYAVSTGSPTSKYAPALAATTLVRGEAFILERHVSNIVDREQIGEVFDNGNVIQARLKSGGALISLANIKSHFTRVTFLQG